MSNTVHCHPIYQNLFSFRYADSVNLQKVSLNFEKEPAGLPWQLLNTISCQDKGEIGYVDFSTSKPAATWDETAKKIAMIVLKVVLFPWGLYELTKYFVQRVAMIFLYPAQSNLVKNRIAPRLSAESLNIERAIVAAALRRQNYIVRHVALEKDGIRYSGLLIGHDTTIHNGKWVLQATGNAEPIEYAADEFATDYHKLNYNTLLINGPGVGLSKGEATTKTMGEAQEIGMTYLETAIKAKDIILAGRSLGGAAIGQGILQHDFKTDVNYTVVRQMTFDRASNIAKKIMSSWVGKLAKNLIIWSGCEMDSIETSKRLQQLGIKEIIIQSTTKPVGDNEIPDKKLFKHDGVIPGHASLGYRLVKEKITQNKVFCCVPTARHMDFNPQVLRPHIKVF